MFQLSAYHRVLQEGFASRGFYLAHARLALESRRLLASLRRGETPPVPLPSMLCLRVVHRCDLRCKMCGQWGLTGAAHDYDRAKQRQELPAADLARVLDALDGRQPIVDMEGGEIFLHHGVLELLELLRRRGAHVKPVTNGTRLATYADDLVRLGVEAISVSIDGDEATHDALRGTPGTFRRAVEGIWAVDHAKRRARSHRPLVQVAATVTRHSAAGVEALCEELARRQLPIGRLMIKQPIFIPPAAVRAYETQMRAAFGVEARSARGFEEDYRDFDPRPLQEALRRVLRRRNPFVVHLLPALDVDDLPRFYDYDALVTPERCTIPWTTPSIEPDGEVYPCALFADCSMGNIRRQGFLDIWYGERYTAFRALLARGLLSVCRRCCQLTGA